MVKNVALAVTIFLLLSSLGVVGFAAAPTSESSFVHPLTTTTGAVYFNETGLPSGISWSVVYNSLNQSSTTSSIKFTETVNIEYNYKVNEAYSGVTQYAPSPQTGTAKAVSSVSISFSGSTFTANLTSSHDPTDVNVKTWYYSAPSGPAPSGHYYAVYAFINGANTSSMSVSSNGIVYVGYYIWATAGSDTIYFQYHVNGTSLNFDSSTLTVTVNPPVTVSISSSKNPIDYGMSVTFNSNVTGGTPPYSYQWWLNGANVTGATSSTWTTNTLPVGNDSIRVWVTDSVGDPAPGHPNSHIPAVILSINPLDKTIYIGDSFGISVNFVGSQAVWNGNSSAYKYAWYVNGQLIPGAVNSSIVASQNTPGTYVYTVRLTGTGHGTEYKGKWIGRMIVHVTGELAPNSIKFVESGLPVGSYWSAAIIVTSENSSYPLGTMFWDPDGLITKVTSNGLPAVVINPPNGTWTWFVRTYVWNNTTQSFELNSSMNYASSPYVANITHGIVKMPSISANGSIIIHIQFTSIKSPSNDPPNQTSTGTTTIPLNAATSNSTIRPNDSTSLILPTTPQSGKTYSVLTYLLGPAAASSVIQNISERSANFVLILILSIMGISFIAVALVIKQFNRKKQRNREVQD